GIKSTIAHLGSQQFNRLRVGIDRPTNGMSVPDYVLGKFSKEEQPELDKAIISSVEACETWLDKPFLEVMNKFN
ncbi:aminoacyl-tRNA hydrolase, partial [Micrococcus sp. SIMBA_144]